MDKELQEPNKLTGNTRWSPRSVFGFELRGVEIARKIRTAIFSKSVKAASLAINKAILHQRITKAIANVRTGVVDVFGDHLRSKERASVITPNHELKDALIDARHPLNLLDHQSKISPDCLIIPPFSGHIHSFRVLRTPSKGNAVASTPFGVTLWSRSITNESRSTADHARARSLRDATDVSTHLKTRADGSSIGPQRLRKVSSETMSKSNPRTQESIATGQADCPHCNEIVDSISDTGPGARILRPCGHLVSEADVDEPGGAEHVEAFGNGGGAQIMRDTRWGGVDAWIQSDTTAADLGVDPQ